MSDKAIIFRNVDFSYGKKKIINDFSLSVDIGEKICFFGESGNGKTTLLRLICGLAKPDSGELFVYSKKIRPVFQEDRLLPFLTSKENVEMFSEGKSADEIFEKLNLAGNENLYPSELSGGMARRVSIARALSSEGDIYIFDEPLSGLDDENKKIVLQLIADKTAGKTVICVLHDKETAEAMGCRIVDVIRKRQ